jgi:hypothetical protein
LIALAVAKKILRGGELLNRQISIYMIDEKRL